MENDFTLEKDGFEVLNNFLDPSKLDELRRNLEHILGHRHGSVISCPSLEWLALTRADVEELDSYVVLDQINSHIVERFGPTMVPIHDSLRVFNKLPGGHQTLPHQDCAFTGADIRRTTIWIPLDDVDPQTGGLYYWPGSHRGGALPHIKNLEHDPAGNTLILEAVWVPLGILALVTLVIWSVVAWRRRF